MDSGGLPTSGRGAGCREGGVVGDEPVLDRAGGGRHRASAAARRGPCDGRADDPGPYRSAAVIAKVLRGWRPAGLLAYLIGPGRHEEHRNPRVVASWDGAPWLHHPDPLNPGSGDRARAGEFDLDLRALVRTMVGPAAGSGLPTHGLPGSPPSGPLTSRAGYRCLRTHQGGCGSTPTTRELSPSSPDPGSSGTAQSGCTPPTPPSPTTTSKPSPNA